MLRATKTSQLNVSPKKCRKLCKSFETSDKDNDNIENSNIHLIFIFVNVIISFPSIYYLNMYVKPATMKQIKYNILLL